MVSSVYERWMNYARNNEQNKEFLKYLVFQRNGGREEFIDEDYKMLESFCNAGIIASPPADDYNFFLEFLEESGITKEELGYSQSAMIRFWDGFIIPSWGTGSNFLFCVNHNKERKSGLDGKYINIYPDNKKEILSDFRFYGLESTAEALSSGAMCVCEGIFDRIRLEAEGFPAMTTLGSKISSTQIRIMNRFDRIILIGDNDRAGREAQKDIMKGVKRVSQYLIPYEKDIDDLAKKRPEVFKEFIQKIR